MSSSRTLRTCLTLFLSIMVMGCKSLPFFSSTATPTSTVTPTPIPPTETSTPTHTATPTYTLTPTMTYTPTWVFQSGNITCPILLYHRVAEYSNPYSLAARYYMPPSDFRWQMQSLKDWGYTSISISYLVQAITVGAELPARPVVITFDDGYASVYENAYPIMKEMGFSGVLYLIGNAVGADDYMSAEQVKEMIASGWEVGSHSMTHPHLPEVTGPLAYELADSRDRLNSLLGSSINTFAYPFGDFDLEIIDKVVRNGYLAGVGLGSSYTHDLGTLYYLSRIEIVSGIDGITFASMLPWTGQP